MSASAITTPSPKSLPSSEEVLNDLLVLPQHLPATTGRRKKAINDKAKEITDAAVLQELKEKEQTAADAKKMKKEIKMERQERGKKKRRERSWNEKKEKERKTKEKSKKAKKQRRATKRAPSPADTLGLESLLETLLVKLDVEDNGQCSSCAVVISEEEDRFWVCCDRCDKCVLLCMPQVAD